MSRASSNPCSPYPHAEIFSGISHENLVQMTSFCWNDLPDPADLPFPSCCSRRPSLSGEGASATAPCTEQCSCMGFPSCWQRPSTKPSNLLLTKEKSSAQREAGQDTVCCSDRIENYTAQNSQNYNKHAHACMSCLPLGQYRYEPPRQDYLTGWVLVHTENAKTHSFLIIVWLSKCCSEPCKTTKNPSQPCPLPLLAIQRKREVSFHW